mmetsp:Transcript_14047/g.15498  ORF Transcript_14047/g.15498 Transcript_14047/m.15498 type:complete len:88 (-) Transcript_14047:231-494(-)
MWMDQLSLPSLSWVIRPWSHQKSITDLKIFVLSFYLLFGFDSVSSDTSASFEASSSFLLCFSSSIGFQTSNVSGTSRWRIYFICTFC